MSQAKVDRYKNEKANRKKIMKQTKIKKVILSVVGTVVCVVAIGWVGYSGYNYFAKPDASNPTQTEVDMSAINDYMEDLGDTE